VAWVALFTLLRADSRHGPELFLRYLDAAWADCVVSVQPELRLFYGELPTPELAMNEYKVGYKKPPKEHQFKPKHQTAARPNGRKRKENSPDVAGWLDKPLKVKRGGKSIRMHPHQVAMTSLGKRALNGEPRAIKLFLKECAIAGLLTPQLLEQTHGAFAAPRGVDLRVAKVMIETYGFPPWEPDEYAAIVAEFERDQAHIEDLHERFLKNLNHG
jgi:Family of unknown function (DUF5681)